MGKRDLSRRQFLARAAAGAGVAAGASLGREASAAEHPATQGHSPETHGSVAPQSTNGGDFVFFNTAQGRTVDAIAERLIPTDELGPGAHDAGVVFFIDRALATVYATQQEPYRAGLASVDAYSQAQFGAPFRDLAAEQQDAVLRAMEGGTASGFTAPTAQAFFNTLWTHVREGMFADPVHGGNRNFIGWRLLRHPGVQWENSAAVQFFGAEGREIYANGHWGFALDSGSIAGRQ